MEVNTNRITKVNEVISAIEEVIALLRMSPVEAVDQISLVTLDAIRTLYTSERSTLNKLDELMLKDAATSRKSEIRLVNDPNYDPSLEGSIKHVDSFDNEQLLYGIK